MIASVSNVFNCSFILDVAYATFFLGGLLGRIILPVFTLSFVILCGFLGSINAL